MKAEATYFCLTVDAEVTEQNCMVRYTYDWTRGFGLCRKCERGAALCPNLHPVPEVQENPDQGLKVQEKAVNVPKVQTPGPRKKPVSVFGPPKEPAPEPEHQGKTKKCSRCKRFKPEGEFRVSEYLDGPVATCMDCEKRYGLGPWKRKKGAA